MSLQQADLFSEAPREVLAGESGADEQTGEPIPKAGADNTGSSVPDLSRSRAARVCELAGQALLTDAERGLLDVLLDRHVPVDSPRLLHWLYDLPDKGGWGFPPRYIKEGSRNTTRLARDSGTLLAAYRVEKDARLTLVLRLLRLRAEQEALNVKLDRE